MIKGEQEHLDFNSLEFLNLLPEMVFEVDQDLNIKFLNRSCEDFLGYKKEELINKKIPLEDLIISSDLNEIKNRINNVLEGKKISGNSYRVYNKSKEIVTLEIYNSQVRNNQKITGLRCIAVDVTNKEQDRIKISSQENHFRQIFQNIPLPYQSLDINGNILDVNPAWEEILGYKKSEIIGKKLSRLLTKDKQERFDKAFEIFKKKGIVNNVNFDLTKKNGKIIHVNYHGRIEYLNNQFLRTHCIFNDITLQQKAEQTLISSEQKLRELNATKDKFFSIIAHDLKNPFNDLIGFTQLLSLNIDKYDKAKIKQFANIIHQSSKLAHNLLENLLEWSRSQTGTLKYHPKEFIINNLIDENISLLKSTAQNKNIKIYSELDANIFVYADINMIRTVIRNLISNAIKYTNHGGYIKINYICNKNNYELNISDNGIGISKENIEKIFKIDENLSTSGTEDEKGTGLGLILCKELIEKNNGKIWVKSTPNKGSTFTFSLPIPKID